MSEEKVLQLLEEAYYDELETIMNYTSHAANLETLMGQELAEEFRADVQEELTHAQRLSERIHVLGGHVPGSADFEVNQGYFQPLEDHSDVVAVLEGAIDAELDAQDTYEELVDAAQDAEDHVTEDMAIELLEDEQHHERELRDLLAEFEEGHL